MQRSCGPAASSSASTAGHSRARVGLDRRVELELAPGEHDRGAVVADRPETRMRSPGAQARRRQRGPPVDRAHPGGREVHLIAWPRSTPCVAATTWTPARLGGARDGLDLGAQHVGRQALLEHIDRLSASGRRARHARSLTVPLTASSPIDPPGKRIGLTTKLSVVRRHVDAADRHRAASASAASAGEAKAGTNRPSISVWVAFPPAPWPW
jgi:hypothetical protein